MSLTLAAGLAALVGALVGRVSFVWGYNRCMAEWQAHDRRRDAALGHLPVASVRLHAADGRTSYFWCHECGARVAVDEDGCCTTCGRDTERVTPYPPDFPVNRTHTGH